MEPWNIFEAFLIKIEWMFINSYLLIKNMRESQQLNQDFDSFEPRMREMGHESGSNSNYDSIQQNI